MVKERLYDLFFNGGSGICITRKKDTSVRLDSSGNDNQAVASRQPLTTFAAFLKAADKPSLEVYTNNIYLCVKEIYENPFSQAR